MTLRRSQQFDLQFQRDFAHDRVESILSESPPALREKIEWIRDYFEDELRRGITGRYSVAVIIKEIFDDVNENNGGRYGAKAVKAIKDSFDWDDGVIYQALHVADAFTPEQIESIAAMRSPLGKPLSFSHVVTLAKVEDGRQREKLLKQAVNGGWTYRKLVGAANLPADPRQDRQQGRRGRPLAKPRDFDAVLDQQDHFAQDFLDRDREVWPHEEHSLSAKAEDLDTSDFTRELADRLKRHAELMSLLADKARERAGEALQVRDRFLQVLERQAAGLKRLGMPATESTGA